ncbi:MAG: hypothetical protein GOVbin564_33 [Prokaryotic dsDNA virus sp.]|nr:MAG: hypothetical protein GOVbin564_33 [Prokaryotic dsDNA virus sp.]
MTYKRNLGTRQVEFRLALASLSLASYSQGATYSLASATGNLALSISSGVITLSPGRYMIEGYPYVDVVDQNDVITFVWQENSSGSFADVGIVGQVQVSGDAVGERDVALATINAPVSVDVKLIVKTLTSTGTPTDAGGCIVVWKEVDI